MYSLEKVHQTTVNSKEISNAVGARSMTDVTQTMPGVLAGISGRLVARTGLMSRLSPVANCVVTNVPGPQIPLYFTGAKLVANFGLGLPMEGMGLFHCVLSYNGEITVAVTNTNRFLFSSVTSVRRKAAPIQGIEPNIGTRCTVSCETVSMRPPNTTVSPLSTTSLV